MADSPKKAQNDPEATEFFSAFTSLFIVFVAVSKFRGPGQGRANVSRQPPIPRRRQGTIKSPRGIQARHRREVRPAILYHELGWEGCTSVSLRGMGADRAEVGGALHLQSYEEEVP